VVGSSVGVGVGGRVCGLSSTVKEACSRC
jgi:hypothetical protein